MRIREPVVAGQFYSAQSDECRQQLTRLMSETPDKSEIEGTLVGGIVPHAGWQYSGSVTAGVFNLIAASRQPDVVILFGGVHRYRGRMAAVFGSGRWESPLGSVAINERLVERLLSQTNQIVDDPYAHESEHSIEVQIPFVQRAFPNATIVPIMVPPVATAHEVGAATARTVKVYGYDVVVIGTTDLTHYGPRYGFTPKGVGAQAHAWTKVDNDARFIDGMVDMKADEVVQEAATRKNACSAGAVAATIAAARELGATHGTLLKHTTSAEVSAVAEGEIADFVGYAGVVFSG